MKRVLLFSLLSALLMLSLSAFQCSSTELTSAKLYIQQKNYAKALEALQKEISKNPKSDEGFYLLGFLQGEKGDYKSMLENYDKSLSISKRFAKQIEDSKKYHWGSSFNKGVAFFNRAVKSGIPEDSANANYTKTIQAFSDAIMIEPDSADTYKNLAFAYISAKRTDEAIKPLEKLIAAKKTEDAYKTLGQIYANKGAEEMASYKTGKNAQDSVDAMANFEKAIAVLEEGRKTYPDNSDILLLLSNAYISANKAEVAMGTFKAGVEKEPENKYYRYNYGVLLLGANQFEPAIEQFQKATELDPQYQNALYNLAVAYVKWGTAIREKADQEGVENPEYKNKFNQALPFLKRVLEIKPDDSLTWDTIAKVYAVLGMSKEAQEAYDKADQYRK